MQTLDQLFPDTGAAGSIQSCDAKSLPASHRRYRYFAAKYRIERVLGFGLLMPAMPLIAICWCAVKFTSRGPGIYRQTRVGHEGKTFQVLKLRTMRVDAEANGPQWSSRGDARITRLGRVLRKLHLDELPQLVNVAKGEMVLVGPRPERPEFVALLSEVIPGYERRLIVKPGITGMAQINLPPDTDLRSVERKQILDLYHIDNADFWLDKRMVLLTAFRVLSISNDRLTRLMGLDRKYLVQHLPAETTGSTSTPLSTLMAETTAKQSLERDSQPTEDEIEARDFHAAWDGDVETWEDDTHDSWEGMSLSENSPR
jgi:lipopolysaccharide/colanic/teichoic acid biosynthesis glycosyltransferase